MNIINNFSLDDIVKNLGIGYIYKVRHGVVNKLRGAQDYYEVVCADLGFLAADDIFVSLMNDVGTTYPMGNCFDEDKFVIDFKSFSDLSSEYTGYEPELFLEKYKSGVGKFYTWDFEKKISKRLLIRYF